MRPVNLIPQDQRRHTTGQRPGSAYAVLGVLGVLLVMAVVYVMTANQVNSRTSDASAAQAEADRLEAEAAQLGAFASFAQIRQTRLASVAGVAGTRFDWERLVREVSRIMPERSWLQSTDASVIGTDDGSAPAPAARTSVVAPVGPSATFVGCTPRQSDVARMMVRMRQMHRVEDVELNESVQEPGGNPASVESCGSYYKFDLTVRFSAAAAVAGEAPLGATRVPASLGGGS